MKQFVVGLTAILVGCAAANRCPTTPRHSFSPEEEAQLFRTECGAPYHWKQADFPIPVRATGLPEGYASLAEEAVEIWNGVVGHDFLLWDEEAYTCSSAVEFEEGAIRFSQEELGINEETQTRKLGTAYTRTNFCTGEIGGSLITLDLDVEPSTLLAVILHEIGHALGLAHDETNPESMLFPITWEPRIQRITPDDIALIQAQLPEGLPQAPPVHLAPSPLAPLVWQMVLPQSCLP